MNNIDNAKFEDIKLMYEDRIKHESYKQYKKGVAAGKLIFKNSYNQKIRELTTELNFLKARMRRIKKVMKDITPDMCDDTLPYKIWNEVETAQENND